MTDSQGSLLEQVRSGANRRLQQLAAEGLLPLPPEQIIPLQVALAASSDQDLALRAAAALRGVDARVVAPFLAGQADAEVLEYFASEIAHPLLVETILRRRDVPRRLLTDLAGRLPPDFQELLLLRQDAIVEEPRILDALERNPALSAYARRRIGEYREHLLPRERPVAAPAAAPAPVAEPAGEDEELDEEAFRAALESAKGASPEGEVEEQSGLTEGQIRMLPVPARIRLTRGASRLLRTILLRDPNARVALSVIANNALSDQEVEQIAHSRVVAEEVLLEIARRREWNSKPGIVRSLVQNPRTPVASSLRLVPRLSVRDLREVSRDRNIPDAVRSTALRLYRIKRQ